MDNKDCHKFYHSKLAAMVALFLCVGLYFGSFFLIPKPEWNNRLVGYFWLITSPIFVIKAMLLFKKVVAETTSFYIVIDGTKLWWTDIVSVKRLRMPSSRGGRSLVYGLFFYVKDISKYREIGSVTKYLLSSRSPWCIPESVLDREDLKILKQIIKQHVQDCDFE